MTNLIAPTSTKYSGILMQSFVLPVLLKVFCPKSTQINLLKLSQTYDKVIEAMLLIQTGPK